jgi:serine/threonine protein kinase
MPDRSRTHRPIAVALALMAAVASGCGDASPAAAIDQVDYQAGDRRAEDAWRPARPTDSLPGDAASTTVWLRLRPPPLDAPDPALRVGYRLVIEEVWIDERPIVLGAMTRIVPLPQGAGVVILRGRSSSDPAIPSLHLGSQHAFWVQDLRREVPELAIAGALLLAGVLLLGATLRRGSARAYRGLGLFLGSLGLLTLLQLDLLRSIVFPAGRASFYAHEVPGYLYPIGFADFVLAIFGDGRRRGIARGLRVYVAYVAVVWTLYFAGVTDITVTRAGANAFMLVLTALSLSLATTRARAGDRAARAFLFGIAGLMAIAMPDVLDGMGFFSLDFQTVPYGVLAFGLAMAVVVERRLAETRDALAASADELSGKVVALEERNREVQTLNVELRHQIAERSRQLADALEAGVHSTRALELREGEVIDGRYRVLRLLGQGGMGSVHEVERVSDGRRLALKRMSGHAHPTAAARFAREAEIAARLAHPHLVAVVDVSGARSDGLYLVMELVPGRPLEEERGRFGDVPWGLSVLAQIAEGLAALHEAGVVHRDLKPGNVLLQRAADGGQAAKISDFGISRFGAPDEASLSDDAEYNLSSSVKAPAETLDPPVALWQQDAATPTDPSALAPPPDTRPRSPGVLTGTGVVMGTPGYMAPELARGARRARPSSDMFAFGLIAYEVLAGRSAFAAPPVLGALGGARLPPVEPLPAAVPAEVASLVLRCLDEVPRRRPSAADAASVLRRSAAPVAVTPRAGVD